ncbi:hypothetical protein FSOLCH5_002131 [Fusarium solani]|uniref:uncharacterized protein n=1 Tax=Fusarium solani TaxID=169388 RepID=UPI00230FC060|nr:hypothetical protein MRS44_010716 [Fusarium solani]KAJ4227919.1 hypothetical protein NW759_004009 [Fusarium solani]
MDMVIDTFPQYRLWKRSLLDYLKQQFPSYSNDISVEEHGTVYRLTIPQKLTSAQRNHILKYVCYRPESDDD